MNKKKKDTSSFRSYGKVSKEFFDSVIYRNLGASRAEVLVGPALGVDTSIVRISSGEVLAATTDPLSFIPELGPEDSAWLSVNLIASDLSTSSFKPQYAIFDLNLPPTMDDLLLERYLKALGSECEKLGISIIGGHTGRFEGCDYTIVGSGTMLSVGATRNYLTSSGAHVGDNVILTKGAAIAATGILARVFPERVRQVLGAAGLDRARGYFRQASVVRDALSAARVGVRSAGVTAMHDVTEGGVLSALYELAAASGVGIRVDRFAIALSEETKAICDLFALDPLRSLGEGALVLSCIPSKTNDVLEAIRREGIGAAVVGEIVPLDKKRILRDGTTESEIDYPVTDPYWKAYYTAKENDWA